MSDLRSFVRSNGAEFMNTVKNLGGTEKSFSAGEVVMPYSQESADAAILLSGSAYLAQTNGDGQRSILDIYGRGSLFGPGLSGYSGRNPYYVFAKTKCTAVFFTAASMAACRDEMLMALLVFAAKSAMLHVDILSRRTIREKLISFFEGTGEREMHLGISFVELADYLAVNRSAMMRELSAMNADGLIRTDGRRVTLLF